ncbi:MAG: hypothetical protein P8P30_09470 [Rickettsiales bacterium]|nr:hypothetical protein [Rickettsiales bacterium]
MKNLILILIFSFSVFNFLSAQNNAPVKYTFSEVQTPQVIANDIITQISIQKMDWGESMRYLRAAKDSLLTQCPKQALDLMGWKANLEVRRILSEKISSLKKNKPKVKSKGKKISKKKKRKKARSAKKKKKKETKRMQKKCGKSRPGQ